jgi:hypothetical protein
MYVVTIDPVRLRWWARDSGRRDSRHLWRQEPGSSKPHVLRMPSSTQYQAAVCTVSYTV